MKGHSQSFVEPRGGYYVGDYFEKQVLSFCHGPIHKEHDLKLINPATLVHEGEVDVGFPL